MTNSLTPYDHHLMFSYLANAASRLRYRSKETEKLIERVADNADELNLNGMIRPPRRRSFLDECKAGQSKRDRQALRKILEGKRSTTKRVPEDVTARRIRNLGKTMGLSPMDVAILNFLTRCETQTIIESMVDEVCEVTFRRRPA